MRWDLVFAAFVVLTLLSLGLNIDDLTRRIRDLERKVDK